jgi:hypothetical protein
MLYVFLSYNGTNFLALVNIEQLPDQNRGEVVLKEDTKIKFIGIDNNKGETFFP